MSFSTGCRKCMKCGKMYLISLFDDGLCAECEKAEQEPTTLQQIIEKHNMVNLAYDEMSDFERDILKYAEQEPKWIPVSERLPEENKQVLIQYRTRYRDDVNLFDVTSRADYNYWQGIGREIDVIAWMPLPKPYKPQEREDKE